MTRILAAGNHTSNRFFVDGESVAVEVGCRVGMTLAEEETMVAIRVIGQKILIK